MFASLAYRTALAALLLAAAAPVLHAQDYSVSRVGPGSRSTAVIDAALEEHGFRPARLSQAEVRAINDTWRELFGNTGRAALTRRQAVAVVYLALVHPYESRRADRARPEPVARPLPWARECDGMAADAYRLGNLVAGPEWGAGLFVQDPERGEARTLARRIQERAVECRAFGVADRASEVISALASNLPSRADLEQRVAVLKREIEDASPVRAWR